MSSLVVKFQFNADIRRVRLDDAATRSFTALLAVVHSTFPSLAASGVVASIQYEDDEGDRITIGSDAEVVEALRVAASDGRPSLRFIVTANVEPAAATTDASKRVKTEQAATSVPTPAVEPPTPTVGTGVPVAKLLTLVSILRQEFASNPMGLIAAGMAALGDARVGAMLGRLLPLWPNVAAVAEAASTDPALKLLLSLPVVAPFLGAADIDLAECVPESAPAPAASAPVDPATLLPSLLQQFAGLGLSGFGGPFGGCSPFTFDADEPAATPAETFASAPHVGALPVHVHVTCDGCGMSPIIGSRHKCTVCPDFDLCGVCAGTPGSHAHPLRLLDAPVPYEASPIGTVLGGKPVHTNVACDGCGAAPIVGARFKCTVCVNYDVCEMCEAADVHASHPLLKIRDTTQTPAKIIAVLRPDQAPDAPTHATVDSADTKPWRQFWGRGCRGGFGQGGRGGGCGEAGRGRKHQRSWGPAGRHAASASASPSREDAALQAAIEASLQAPTVDAAAPAVATAVAAPEKAFPPVVTVKPEQDELVARFVTHVTLTDTAAIVAGSNVVKTWKMKNDGVTAWPVGTRLVHVGAETLGCPVDGVAVPAVAPGSAVDISIPLVAPDMPGRHVGYFRLVTPGGVRFGHRIWADLFVDNSNVAAVVASVPAPAPAPAPVAVAVAVAVPTPAPAVVEPVFVATPAPSAPPMPLPSVGLPSLPEVPALPAKWQSQLLQLAEMGFYDLSANVEALEVHGGNIARAMDALIR